MIENILREELMILDLKATTKEEAIKEMIHILKENNVISNSEEFSKVIWDRENISTTGVGDGIAIPHGKSNLVTKPSIVFARSKKGIDFNSLDNKPALLFFMIATPDDTKNEHLKILSTLSGQLMKKEVVTKLLALENKKEVISCFNFQEKKINNELPIIVAITGCSTGIAHTFMAAEKLHERGLELGYNVIVETNGSTGIENKLTTKDIDNAIGVIIASDISIKKERFIGKPLLNVKVADGIHKADELILNVANAKIFDGEQIEQNQNNFYKHLLSGVSHMLPFVVGGGIAIAIAFLIDQIIGVPQESLSSLGSYSSLAKNFMSIGGMAFGFMLPVLAGYIAHSIADRPGLVVGFVAGGLAATGGAGFLGALIGGFLAGYLVKLLKALFEPLPKSLDGIKTILFYPVLGVIIIGMAMLLINVPMKWVNTGLTDFLNNLSGTNAIVLGLILGTMMAIDLGGPINKSAYIFATGTLAATVTTGGSSVMAAVMAAGMVPPLAVFVSTILYKKKYQESQRQAGLTNLVLGASFITEGAIPFAASDPIRMIPSFVLGSAISSALVLMLDIKVMAPHGGIFVIFLVSKPLLYIGMILIGTFISAFMIGILKKDLE